MVLLNFAFVIHMPTNSKSTIYINVRHVLHTVCLPSLVDVVTEVYCRHCKLSILAH